MLGRTDSRARLILLFCFLGFVAAALGLRLAYWQIGQADRLRQMAGAQLTSATDPQLRRGEIVDNRGTVLATTAYRDRLAAYPDLLAADDRPAVAQQLGRILGLSVAAQEQLLTTLESGVPYAVVANRLTADQSDAVRAGLRSGDLAALDLEPQPVRFYPNIGGSPDSTLASQLIGFVTDDGMGRYGIEQYGQDLLAGSSGATAEAGADPGAGSGEGQGAAFGAGGSAQATSGEQVRLTIDASLQLRLEKELYAAWVADRAPRVSALVMDPYTGAILAWASVPGYDANEYVDVARRSPDLFADPIASQIYEPGSVMKLFTAAAALESGVVTLNTPITDGKVLRIGPDEVRNGDHGSIGTVPFEDIIARSRNVGTGKVALMLGDTTDAGASVLYGMWQRLGIGQSTGIELGNESLGLVADPQLKRWQTIDLVNRAFGQAVAITPLQLARGYAAMINGGRLPVAHLVAAVGGQPVVLPDSQQVIETSLSDTLRDLMVHVVEAGPHYASETLIPDYVVGGKTGTAQIWDQRTSAWMEDTYNHTFVGFVGNPQPRALILVRIHDTEPHIKKNWGMTLELTSNELFRRVAMDVIATQDLAPLPSDAVDDEAPAWIAPDEPDASEAPDE